MSIPLFIASAFGGYFLMTFVGIQALISLFSSIPLAKRRYQECPEFNLGKAHRRIVRIIIVSSVLVAVITVTTVFIAPTSVTTGYLFGMILAFLLSMRRMSPNNAQNQRKFASAFADCYPSCEDGSDDLEDTVVIPRSPDHRHGPYT